jgi:hypothetical protein
MPAHTVKCPECRTTLKSRRPIPVGKLLTCPKCDVLFAAPKPVLDVDVVEEVDVVEDVDVIEDVEVVDESAPSRKPARKPASAAQTSRVNAGIEVVEDDEDDKPRLSKKKAALRPKRKSGGGGAKVVAIIAASVLGLAVLGGGVWLAFYLFGGGGDEPLAYLPPESPIVFGIDGKAILESPLGAQLEPFLNSPMSPMAKVKQATNGQPRDLLQRIVVGVRPEPGGKPGMTVVVKSAVPLDLDKLGAALSGSKSSVAGRTVYRLPPGAGPTTLAVPNKYIAVFADLADEPLGRVLKSSGKSSVLSGDMATLASKFGSSTIWAAVSSNDPAFKSGFDSGFNAVTAGNPAMKGLADAMQSSKGFALALNLAGDQVDVKFAVLCPDDGAAQRVTSEFQQAAEKSKNDAMSNAMMAMMPAPVKALAQEAESSQQFTTDGSLAVMSMKFSMSTLQSAIGAASSMAAAFGGGGPPGMQPGPPPGEQPRDRGGDGGGRRKGGRGKGKGGGG